MQCVRYNTGHHNYFAILSMDVAQQQEMIRQAQAGNAAAFERLLDHHYDLIYRFAYKWCGNAAAAEDVAQLVCIKLANSLAQFRFESAFTSWLYRIVINCAKDWQKAENRHAHQSDDEAELDTQPSANVSNAEQHIYLSQLLSRINHMGEGFRETALLVHSEGFNHREAAEILGVKESTISWRIHEIRKRLTSEDGGQSS